MIKTDVLIVGGGLAGLRLAQLLHEEGRDFHLIEARSRFGGRILSHTHGNAHFDLGPAWFWPGQPRMAALAKRFGLEVFEQWAKGDFRFENAQGAVQQGRGFASMQGSLRLKGGMASLTDAIVSHLPQDRLHLSTELSRLTREGQDISAKCGQSAFDARHVVMAIPPRLAADISYAPALPGAAVQTMQSIPTWMAGQAKAVILYDRPFWRDAGLSGDAMSHRGPMVEIHDASPAAGRPFALFGFIGVAPAQRQDETALKAAIQNQLLRLFGSDGQNPASVILQDWATEHTTATAQDTTPLTAHPRYGLPAALRSLWDGRLTFGGTEVAHEFGGFLEGALEAAEQSYHILSRAPEKV